jgi:hypothetical protein
MLYNALNSSITIASINEQSLILSLDLIQPCRCNALETNCTQLTAFGKGLSEELRGGGPAPIGGSKANLSEPLAAVSTP